MALKQTLTSGYGTGLSKKQQEAVNFRLDPGISDSQDASSDGINDDIESVLATPIASAPLQLSLKTTTSLVTSAALSGDTHVALGDGVLGQVKRIIHFNKVGSKNLQIKPDNFAAGSKLTSDAAKRSVTLMYDGDNWQVIAGEITGTAEFVIG